MLKNLDETVRLQSEKREEWIQEIGRDRLQGIAEGASSAPRPSSSSAASFPRRNKCRGTHCSLIEQRREKKVSATEFEIEGKTEDKTGWRESERKGGEKKWQTCWCCQDQQRAYRMARISAEKLERTGPAEKERVASVPQREQLASMPEPPFPKGEGTDPSH